MERVAFLLEDTGERLCCLLNPESLVFRRRAGIQPRLSWGDVVTGVNQTDDQLIYSGGGSTELTLDLLFDVSLSGSTIETDDVRALTTPIWNLAENAGNNEGYGGPPLVRFVWGKSWNFSGVVTEAAERLEYFSGNGLPQRSWLRMRMRRVTPQGGAEPTTKVRSTRSKMQPYDYEFPGRLEEVHQVVGGEYLYQIADRFLGDPAKWRELATFNNIDDPLRLSAGSLLNLPALA